jgi:SPP1 family phage portal protein
MTKLRTDKEVLSTDDILNYIKAYEADDIKKFDKLWEYYLGKNTEILNSKSSDPSDPDNKTPVPYGRKIITTFTGYAYRPRYITYKSDNQAYLDELTITFNENNEHIKTSLDGRNTGIFGLSYELMYIGQSKLTGKAEAKFALIDPRQMILIYDNEIEPNKKIAIRFYPIDKENGKWEAIVYYADRSVYYSLNRKNRNDELVQTKEEPNVFKEVPVVAYYLGEEAQGIIEPVIPLIDDYDLLLSGAMLEFDRFSNSYLRLVKMSMDTESARKLKKSRIFQQLPDKDAVSFLTKDIPTQYIEFMTGLVRDQIHIQSHVPDLGSSAFKDGVSGVAIQRLMFDFENVVSNAEAEFDTALYDRIRLITSIYNTTNRAKGTFDEITISHKRNAPLNLKEFADTAYVMFQAGFSKYLIADIMPDDIIPDVEQELQRQEEDAQGKIPDVMNIPPPQAIDGQTNPDGSINNPSAPSAISAMKGAPNGNN